MSTSITAANVQLKRAYERATRGDGTRILIDRLWPRGMTKEAAAIDEWFKDIAPSTALRQWFGHDPARWQEFRHRYALEVRRNPDQFRRLRDAPNLFVMGASVYPFNGGYNPTGTVGALTYWAVDATKNKYLHSPGKLM